jgi:hypothetical protein
MWIIIMICGLRKKTAKNILHVTIITVSQLHLLLNKYLIANKETFRSLREVVRKM